MKLNMCQCATSDRQTVEYDGFYYCLCSKKDFQGLDQVEIFPQGNYY